MNNYGSNNSYNPNIGNCGITAESCSAAAVTSSYLLGAPMAQPLASPHAQQQQQQAFPFNNGSAFNFECEPYYPNLRELKFSNSLLQVPTTPTMPHYADQRYLYAGSTSPVCFSDNSIPTTEDPHFKKMALHDEQQAPVDGDQFIETIFLSSSSSQSLSQQHTPPPPQTLPISRSSSPESSPQQGSFSSPVTSPLNMPSPVINTAPTAVPHMPNRPPAVCSSPNPCSYPFHPSPPAFVSTSPTVPRNSVQPPSPAVPSRTQSPSSSPSAAVISGQNNSPTENSEVITDEESKKKKRTAAGTKRKKVPPFLHGL